jgi:hypothetical protein
VEGTGTDAKRRGFVLTGDTTASGFAGFGLSFANLGNFDSAAGSDLVLTAAGDNYTTVINGGLFYLSGRGYQDGSGLQQLTIAQLGLRDSNGTPNGQALLTLPPQNGELDARYVYSLGNAYNLPNANRTAVDIGLWHVGETSFYLYPGDSNFQQADRILVAAAGGGASYFGQSIATGVDLDGDSIAEVASAGRTDLHTSAAPGTGSLFYSDSFAAHVTPDATLMVNKVTTDTSSPLTPLSGGSFDGMPPAPLLSGTRIVEFVGDLNKDGKSDMAVGSPTLNGSVGAVTILY